MTSDSGRDLTPEQLARLDRLLAAALQQPPAERESFLRAEASDDEMVLAEALSLLAQMEATEEETAALPRLPGDPDETGASPGVSVPRPKRIGLYSIQSVIASGGMGTVYLAVQESPRRRVALKVMKRGIASKSALRRFEYESQILARLRHPSIAQVYEAGTHDDGAGGVPYFAMEYVPNARTIVEYARGKKLGTRERLALFARVCDAVQHGHQKGVIHRDLKPSNILVDSEGEPKIIDFGVARSTDSDMVVTTLQTDIGQLIGTLQYMSPEQCDADPEDLDTRSDVYALGVVLYELLTERLPYDVSRVAMFEAGRVIKEESPARPSTFDRTLRGDVETIALKALEKDRARRYQSAGDFGQDINRYLHDEPIEARPPSLGYQVGRFAARNKPVVLGGSAVLLILLAGLLVSTWLLARTIRAETLAEDRLRAANQARIKETAARQQAENALARTELAEAEARRRAADLEQLAEFQAAQLGDINVARMTERLRQDLLDELRASLAGSPHSDPAASEVFAQLEELLSNARLSNVSLRLLDRSILAQAIDAANEQFADQPLVRARFLQTLATTFVRLGILDRATSPQEVALRIRREELGPEHEHTLSSMNSMGVLLSMQGHLKEAMAFHLDALETSRRVLGNDHQVTRASISNIAAVLAEEGRLGEAEQHYREALGMARRVLGDEDASTILAMNSLAALLEARGRFRESESLFKEAFETSRRVLSEHHAVRLTSMNNLATMLLQRGRLAEAGPLLHQVLAAFRHQLGNEHQLTLRAVSNVGLLLKSQGRLSEAEPYYREALVKSRIGLGPDHSLTLTAISQMGLLLYAQERHSEAEPYLRDALERKRLVLRDDHPSTLSSMNHLGLLLLAQRRFSEAEPLFREALEIRRRELSDDHPDTISSMISLAALQRDLDEFESAEELAAEAVMRARSSLPQPHVTLGLALHHHGLTLWRMSRFDEAEMSLLEAHRLLRDILGPDHDRTRNTIAALIDLYDSWHEAQPDDDYDARAAAWRARMLATQNTATPERE